MTMDLFPTTPVSPLDSAFPAMNQSPYQNTFIKPIPPKARLFIWEPVENKTRDTVTVSPCDSQNSDTFSIATTTTTAPYTDPDLIRRLKEERDQALRKVDELRSMLDTLQTNETTEPYSEVQRTLLMEDECATEGGGLQYVEGPGIVQARSMAKSSASRSRSPTAGASTVTYKGWYKFAYRNTLHLMKQLGVLLMVHAPIMLYIGIGGIIFVALEQKNERDFRYNLRDELDALSFTESQQKFLKDLGYYPDVNEISWTWINASFFALTVISTIGYGNLVPTTAGGQIFCIFYSIVGIGLFGLVMTTIAHLILNIVKLVALYFLSAVVPLDVTEKGVLKYTPKMKTVDLFERYCNEETDDLGLIELRPCLTYINNGINPTWNQLVMIMQLADDDQNGRVNRSEFVKAITLWTRMLRRNRKPPSRMNLLTAIMVTMSAIFVGALGIMWLEGWKYGEACWFTFITLTIVGLGDYAPKTIGGTIYCFWFIVFGLGIVAYLLGAVRQVLLRTVSSTRESMKQEVMQMALMEIEAQPEKKKPLWRKNLSTMIRLLVLQMLIVAIGGGVLQAFEYDLAEDFRKNFEKSIKNQNFTEVQERKIQQLQVYYYDISNNWEYGSACFFALSLTTTIGYGFTILRSPGSKMFVVVYCLVGIPFFGWMITRWSSVILSSVEAALHKWKGVPIRRRNSGDIMSFTGIDKDGSGSISRAELLQYITEQNGGYPPDEELFAEIWRTVTDSEDDTVELEHSQLLNAILLWEEALQRVHSQPPLFVSVVIFLMLLAFIFAFAAIFMQLEGWSYRISVWYCFTTLTTMGFGDYIPRQYKSMALSFLFIYFGLGMMAMLVGAISSYVLDISHKINQRFTSTVKESLSVLSPVLLSPVRSPRSALQRTLSPIPNS